MVKKGFLENMFAKMMPRGADKLGRSKMNFGGIGPKMIKHVMKKHNALTLPQLIELVQEQGVTLAAWYHDHGLARLAEEGRAFRRC